MNSIQTNRWDQLIDAIYTELEKQFGSDKPNHKEIETYVSLLLQEKRLRLAAEKLERDRSEPHRLSPDELQDEIWKIFGMPPEQRQLRRLQLQAEAAISELPPIDPA
jgi:hypothetical protein